MFGESDGRRLVQVLVSGELIAAMCSGMHPARWVRSDGGVSPDAKCVGVYYDAHTNTFRVQFEHESFRLVSPGCSIPQHTGPSWQQVDAVGLCRDVEEGRMTGGDVWKILGVPGVTPPPFPGILPGVSGSVTVTAWDHKPFGCDEPDAPHVVQE